MRAGGAGLRVAMATTPNRYDRVGVGGNVKRRETNRVCVLEGGASTGIPGAFVTSPTRGYQPRCSCLHGNTLTDRRRSLCAVVGVGGLLMRNHCPLNIGAVSTFPPPPVALPPEELPRASERSPWQPPRRDLQEMGGCERLFLLRPAAAPSFISISAFSPHQRRRDGPPPPGTAGHL